MNCLNCGIDIEGKREGAKFCSPKCRVTFNRKASVVTDNVTFKDPDVTDNYEFEITTFDLNIEHKDRKVSERKRKTAKYWYDVPVSGEPIIKKGWPAKPDFLNNRQYFLWWKNNFEEGEKGPILHNPLPVYENVTYKPIKSGL